MIQNIHVNHVPLIIFRKSLTCELPKEAVTDEAQQRPDVEFQLLFGQVDPQFIQYSWQ